MNDEVKIVAEVQVVEVVGNLDVSQEVSQPPKRTKLNDGGAVSSHFYNESIHVHGFQVLYLLRYIHKVNKDSHFVECLCHLTQ